VKHVGDGIIRLTFALPLGIDHVHCYALRASGGAWTIVDAGLGVEDAADRWRSAFESLDAPVERIVVTHFHPDHVGGTAVLAKLTGAPVYQGKTDYAQCERAWGPGRSAERFVSFMRGHGLPADQGDTLLMENDALAQLVHYVRDPNLLDEGDEIDGWDVLVLPGHADGHVCLLRDGVLVAGDALLAGISPTVGLYPDARPDPLGDYLESLAALIGIAPAIAHAGHRETITEPGVRARELIGHHEERLARTRDALAHGPRNAYEVSLELFPEPLGPPLRRFALAETCAHLEYLALRGEIGRSVVDDTTRYALSV
jgi:glyoxylase-like metal-dependent hydrolase (beta-lactamase superfamily II)